MSRHFVTGNFKSHAEFVPDETYGQILDNVVVTCVDIVCVYKGQILIGKRTIEPQPDWWIIGGRMKPGESFEDTAIRNLKRELRLDVNDPQRFSFVNVYNLVWAKRAQEPRNHGCHMTSITLTIELSATEVRSLQPNEEYEDLCWLQPDQVAFIDPHPCLQEMARDITRHI